MEIVGRITPYIAGLLGIGMPDDPRVYLGESNEIHIKSAHPEEYRKYRFRIYEIIDAPDYVGYDSSDGTIEYIKQFMVDGEYVKVAIRMTGSRQLYVRSLYIVRGERVNRFLARGRLKHTNCT